MGIWLEKEKIDHKPSPSASMLEVGILALNWKPSLVQQPVPLHPCGKWVSWLNVEYELSTTASSSASLREVGI